MIDLPPTTIVSFHEENLNNHYYLEGFNANTDQNPYQLDVELNLEIIKISQREPFTLEDGEELKRKRTELDESPYCAWSMGNFMREKYPN